MEQHLRHRRRVGRALADLWRGRDIEIVSTNLDNMRSHPLLVLAASAFVVSPLTQLLLVPVLMWVFGLIQRWLGRTALLAVWVFGHVGATLFVMSMEITALYRHIARFSLVVRPDVGVSYGLAAAVGLLCHGCRTGGGCRTGSPVWRSLARCWPSGRTSPASVT